MPEFCGIYCTEPGAVDAKTTLPKMLASIQSPADAIVETFYHGMFSVAVCRQTHATNAALYQDEARVVACCGEIYETDLPQNGKCQQSVCTIVADLFAKYQQQWPEHANGQFASVIFDRQRNQIALTNDCFGIASIVYASIGHIFLFATKLRAIAGSGLFAAKILPSAICHYLIHSMIPTPNTIYRGAFKLPPASMATLAPSQSLNVKSYWDMRYPEEPAKKWPVLHQEIVHSIERGVKKCHPFEANGHSVGAFLSGGTDSSTVVGMMTRLSQKRIPAFSIGFNEARYNELYYARLAAQHFAAQHFVHFVTPDETYEAIPRLVAAYDEPFGNSSIIPTYFCAKLAKDHGVDIILAGDGGDELFGGNKRYADDKIFQIYDDIPAFWRQRFIEPITEHIPVALAKGIIGKAQKYVKRAKLSLPRRALSFIYYDVHELLSPDFMAVIDLDEPFRQAETLVANCHGASLLNQYLYLDLKYIITDNDLRKVTRMCEIAGVRVRFPFLDRDVVACSERIPSKLKVKRSRLRHAFKEALKDFLPPEIINKKKHGFGLPIAEWLRSDPRIRRFSRDLLLDGKTVGRGYFRQDYLEKLFRLHDEDPTPYFGTVLWQLLALEIWMRQHVDHEVI